MSAPAPESRPSSRTSECSPVTERLRSRILVVAGDIGGDSPDDRSSRDLIKALHELAGDADISVLLTESPRQPALVAGWRSLGIAVQIGPPDPTVLPEAGWGSFSHVILTPSGTLSRSPEWIESIQPQAARVVFYPSLPFRSIEAMAPITERAERSGLAWERSSALEAFDKQCGWADAIWCEDQRDLDLARGLWPEKTVALIPIGIPVPEATEGLAGRRGLVVAALEGHNVLSAAEDAAVRSMTSVVPALQYRCPDTPCTVVSDSPTPMLEASVEEAGATLVGADELDGVLARSRLVLAANAHGTGQREVIRKSLAAGTPFVATPTALGGLELEALASAVIGHDDFELTSLCWELLALDQRWHAVRDLCRRTILDRYGPERRRQTLRRALADLGIAAGVRAPLAPPTPARIGDPAPAEPDRAIWRAAPPHRPVTIEWRPAGTPDPPGYEGPVPGTLAEQYRLWAARYGPNPAVLGALAGDARSLASPPLLSVVVPVYNTDPRVLAETIASVESQIYERWELCIANDGSSNPATLTVLDQYRGRPGFKVLDLAEQSGISGATNAAVSLASGDFVAFLDHDDLLKPHALAQVARWIAADPTIDVIYSDEDRIDLDGQLVDPHIKPDWSPDQLMSQNYMCHLTVVRRSLLVDVGGLRSGFDGSQDYDLVLRLTERTDRIAHIPEPLYSWRAVPGSFTADENAKPYAIPAGQRAIEDALARRGVDGRVEIVASSGRYRVHYPISGKPHVTIIIPTRDRLDLLHRCISSVLERSTYPHFEIVIVDNQSTDAETLAYLGRNRWRVIQYPHRFNYARMVNLAARSVRCDALLFLNNDTEVISPTWIEALLEHAMRPEVERSEPGSFSETGNRSTRGSWWGPGETGPTTSTIGATSTAARWSATPAPLRGRAP